ncbi:MAG: PEP-CTERM sorting domain-containing protein [Planctomycetota bacterium]
MSRTLQLLVAGVLSLLATSATCGQSVVFCVHVPDGRVTVESDVPFAGFTLQSTSDALLPENLPWLGGNPASGTLLLDPDNFVVFSVLSASPNDITAGTTGVAAPPGTYDLGPIVDIAALSDADSGGLSFSYLSDGNIVLPGAPCIPEPTSSLLTCGVLGLALRRRSR